MTRSATNRLYLPQRDHVFTLAVCFLAGLRTETTRPIIRKFDGKVAHGSRKNPLDYGGNPDHVPLGLR